MNKRMIGVALVMLLVLLVCTPRQGFTAERYFTYRVIDNGAAVEITGYTGVSTDLRIPPQIGNLPITRIGNRAFFTPSREASGNLSSVTIPNSVTHIGEWAFEGNQLTSVTIGNSVTHIGNRAFFRNQLTSVTIPNSVTHIGNSAFQNNQLTSITIGNSVTHIGMMAFAINQLTSVTIPNSVRHIENLAFAPNRLTSITIGANVNFQGYPFDNGFEWFYDIIGRRAGTYTNLVGGIWVP